MCRHGVLYALMVVAMLVKKLPTSSANLVVPRTDTGNPGSDENVNGSVESRLEQDEEYRSNSRVSTIDEFMRLLGLCHGDELCDDWRSQERHQSPTSQCNTDREDRLALEFVSDRENDHPTPGQSGAAAGELMETSPERKRSPRQTIDGETNSDFLRLFCYHSANRDLAYCRRVRLADAVRKVAAATLSVHKRRPSSDAIAAIVGICESEGSSGSRRSACFDHYLKNFARTITTSGNRYVGR